MDRQTSIPKNIEADMIALEEYNRNPVGNIKKKHAATFKKHGKAIRVLFDNINYYSHSPEQYRCTLKDVEIGLITQEEYEEHVEQGKWEEGVSWRMIGFDISKAQELLKNHDIDMTFKDIDKCLEYISDEYLYGEGKLIEISVDGKSYKVSPETAQRTLQLIEGDVKQPVELKTVDGNYYRLLQSQGTNSLTKSMSNKLEAAQLDLYGNGSYETKDFKLHIRGYSELKQGVPTTAVKLLDCLTMVATETGKRDTLARLTLKKYMEVRGLKDIKEARKQIARDLDALERIEFEFREKKRGSSKDWLKIKLSGGTQGIKNSIIYFRFNQDYYNCLPDNQFMYLPDEAFTFNDKHNPHSYHFIRQIALHKRMNIGRTHENVLSVNTMLESSPSIPKYEEVKNREYDRYIIRPFERDMDKITCIKWQYREGQPTTYQEFINSSIEIIWDKYPDVKKLETNKKKYGKVKKERKTQSKKIERLEQQMQELSSKVGT